MLLAGVSLAGANAALEEDGYDGILYAIEAQSINLEGTELVVLSACETAQGVVDYSDGVYGLVRAFRTAGARNVLVTLRPVGDISTRDFVTAFYEHWLDQPRSNPAAALRATQLDYIKAGGTPDAWAPIRSNRRCVLGPHVRFYPSIRRVPPTGSQDRLLTLLRSVSRPLDSTALPWRWRGGGG
jgi:CHAT domain-containing protein